MTQYVIAVQGYLASPIEGLVDLFKSFMLKREEDQKIRETIKELNKLSDRELNDIGISRGDIYSVAHGDTDCYANPNLKGWV